MSSPVKYGLLFFAASTILTLIQYFISQEMLFNTGIALASSIGFAILFIYLTIKEERGEESGYTIGDGIKAGMICFGLGTLLSTIFAFILFNIIDPSLIDAGIEFAQQIAEKTANTIANISGMDDSQKAEMMAEVAKQEFPNPFTAVKLGIGWVIGLIFPGIIISLIISAIMKRN